MHTFYTPLADTGETGDLGRLHGRISGRVVIRTHDLAGCVRRIEAHAWAASIVDNNGTAWRASPVAYATRRQAIDWLYLNIDAAQAEMNEQSR